MDVKERRVHVGPGQQGTFIGILKRQDESEFLLEVFGIDWKLSVKNKPSLARALLGISKIGGSTPIELTAEWKPTGAGKGFHLWRAKRKE